MASPQAGRSGATLRPEGTVNQAGSGPPRAHKTGTSAYWGEVCVFTRPAVRFVRGRGGWGGILTRRGAIGARCVQTMTCGETTARDPGPVCARAAVSGDVRADTVIWVVEDG